MSNMTLKTRIAITFSVITAIILISLNFSIYWFSYNYNEIQFFHRLEERVNIASQYYLGENEFGARFIEEIRQRHLQLLPQEKEYIVSFADSLTAKAFPDSLSLIFSDTFIQDIILAKTANFRDGDVMAMGKVFETKNTPHVVIISSYDQFGVDKMTDLRTKLYALFFVYLAMVFVIGRIYATQILKPLKKIVNKVNQIRSNNLHIRLDEEKEPDEIGEISKTFNRLMDRIETSIEIQNNFISNASHELKNPLTAILGETEITLSKERSAEDYKKSMEKISREASRLHKLTLHLLRLAQTSFDETTLHTQEFRIDELIFDIKEDLEESNRANKILIDLEKLPDDPDLLLTKGNVDLIKIALTNIIENGCKFSNNAPVLVELNCSSNFVEVSVTDTGVGIPDDEIRNIYVPFFRATNVRMFQGFGIGLPLTQKIVMMHHGEILVSSEVNKGTKVILKLPNSAHE
ncbi:HAMP domain-containing protein [bacterium]|nr:MAG: HAMP domain-containing protein [bacterium]